MSGQRFELLFFHLNDGKKQPNHSSDDYDKLYKIRPLPHLVVKAFQPIHIPNQELSADESIIGCKDIIGFSICPNKHEMEYQSMHGY